MSERQPSHALPPFGIDEWLPVVDPNGALVGRALRREVHGNPELLHPVVHCLVRDTEDSLLLQLRGLGKDIQPGRWDTSVGGHVGIDESIESAVVREIREEIGVEVTAAALRFLYRYLMRNSIESELVYTFELIHEGPFIAEPKEIDELRFWSVTDISRALGAGVFTPNFEQEFARFVALGRRRSL